MDNTADAATAIWANTIGAAELSTVWSEVCDEADLRETDRSLLWGRQFLNPFTFEDLVREYAELAKVAGDVRKHLQNNA